jgi:hypothetical protein
MDCRVTNDDDDDDEREVFVHTGQLSLQYTSAV